MTDNKLNKTLTFFDVFVVNIAYIVGAGIFAAIGLSSKYGKQFTWLALLVCLMLVIPTGLSYAELASVFNSNGGQYYYVKETMNDELALVSGYLMIITQILSISAITFALTNYLTSIVKVPKLMVSSLILTAIGVINYLGIETSMFFNFLFGGTTILLLFMIGLLGLKNFDKSIFDISKLGGKDIPNILFSSAILSFAFFGFELTTELTEETIDAEKNIPRALISGILFSALLYFLLIVTSLSNLSWKKMSKSATPIVDVAKNVLGGFGGKLAMFLAIVSMLDNILVGNISTSRTIQAMSRSVKMPLNLSKIDSKTKTPLNSIIFVTIGSILGLCMGNFENSLILTNITTLILFLFVNISVILLRIQKPDIERKFKIPFSINNIPVPAVFASIITVLMIIMLMLKPQILK